MNRERSERNLDICKITSFAEESDEDCSSQTKLRKNDYVLFADNSTYGLVVKKIQDSTYLFKLKSAIDKQLFLSQEEISLTDRKCELSISITVRVVTSELTPPFTVNLVVPCNETIKFVAETIAEFVAESKYKLSFVQGERSFKLTDSITEVTLGQTLLCLKGADSVKGYTRFMTIDA